MDPTPRSLLLRLRRPAGAPDAATDWARFVDLYAPLLYHWASRLHPSEADAADLVQDVFLRLVRKLPDFEHDGRHSFRAWLHTVLLNCWRDRCRRVGPPSPTSPDRLARLAAPDPAEAIDDAEYRRNLMTQALRVMQRDFQPSTWRACWATVVEGRPAAEVGAELGLSAAAVYAATARVLRRLRQELQGFLE